MRRNADIRTGRSEIALIDGHSGVQAGQDQHYEQPEHSAGEETRDGPGRALLHFRPILNQKLIT